MAVHPRWRGEHNSESAEETHESGSSPLARGTLDAHEPERLQRRFIPAGAGNTCEILPISQKSAVHPRWRGEHSYHLVAPRQSSGSSPLARGTLEFDDPQKWFERFIPAGAGNTRSRRPAAPARPVHPRWRGEHTATLRRCLLSVGSSPLARGTPLEIMRKDGHERFIPAGAGNTLFAGSCGLESAVHPRWRGEHTGIVRNTPLMRGSSPLARGTLADQRNQVAG